MRIAIDGMGGDNAPQAVVNGVVQALNEFNDLEFFITGPEDIIKGSCFICWKHRSLFSRM